MTNYYKEEFGPSGYSVVRRSTTTQGPYTQVQKSKSVHQFKDSNSSLPPLPKTNRTYKAPDSPYVYRTRERRPLNDDYAKPPPLPSTPSRSRKISFREQNGTSDQEKIEDIKITMSRAGSRRSSISEDIKSPSLSRRPSLKNIEIPKSLEAPKRNYYTSYEGKPYEPTNRAPRPFSTSYLLTGSSSMTGNGYSTGNGYNSSRPSPTTSARASPVRDIGTGIPASALTGNGFSTGSGYNSRRNSISSKDIRDMEKVMANGNGNHSAAGSRRNSISKLPWPEPSPVRELPPPIPKQKVKHYPLPPPSYAEGMIAVSRRLRNRSASPAPSYSEMELSTRPSLVSAALGRPSPSRDMIRMTLCGPPLKQYNYGRDIY